MAHSTADRIRQRKLDEMLARAQAAARSIQNLGQAMAELSENDGLALTELIGASDLYGAASHAVTDLQQIARRWGAR